jgi:hypothetical protein
MSLLPGSRNRIPRASRLPDSLTCRESVGILTPGAAIVSGRPLPAFSNIERIVYGLYEA